MFSGMQGFGSGLGSFLGGLFGNSGGPYEDFAKQYQEWAQKGANALNPYNKAGQQSIPKYQEWLEKMKDPSKFINDTMGKYSESPWAKYQQDQAMRAAQNMGSASGLTGSTPLQLQAQQNASNISSQDMNQWLQNVLGVNSQYGQGNQFMMGQGLNSANSLANLYQQMAQQMGGAAYGQKAGQNQDFWNMISGAGKMLFGF